MHYLADTSRHFLPVDVIKNIIESMAFAKLVRKWMHPHLL